jgi:hypothetical protein
MDAEKLQEETKRLHLEIEKLRAEWDSFLRQASLFLFYQTLIWLILIYFFEARINLALFVIIAGFVWKAGEGVKIQLDLRKTKNSLLVWQQTISLAQQVSE